MTRILITTILLTIFGSVFGQDIFDYHKDFNKILEQSQDSASDYYYPTLLDRFNKNDSTLTDMEVLALQIGFTSDPNYKPYQTIDPESEIKSLIGQKKYEDALVACNELLKTNPVNFTALMEKGFVYMKLNKDSMLFHKEKFMKILHSVMSSGKGTYEIPYFVLSPIDGQTLITHIWGGSIGTMGSGDDSNGYFLDILEMKREDKDPVTLYFHINHATDKMFGEEDLKKMDKKDKKKK